VIKIPHSINVRLSRPYRRLEFGLPEQAFLFLFAFDFNSYRERKNPEAAILAFRKAFPSGRENVRLVPVRPGDYIEYEDQWHWADADIEHAAFFMRKVVADSDFRTRIAHQAKQDIETRFNEAATASAIRKRLADIEALRMLPAGSPRQAVT
jgi:hypothetical protein